jgi:tRNA(Leu) C34 or U34 (ribose-2'-O)-methylase TrmL
MRIALFQPAIPQDTGTIMRHQADGVTRPAVGVPVYTQGAF